MFGYVKRLLVAIRYMFGYKSNFGEWDEFIFKPVDEARLLAYLNKTNLTFRQELEMDIIPRISEMFHKEIGHLEYLKAQPKSETVDEFIEESNHCISHLKKRYNEYMKYAKSLK